MECALLLGFRSHYQAGGTHINIVVLNKKAFSPYMSAFDLWLDGKERLPRAAAVVCDWCMMEKRPPRFAIERDSDGGPIYRVPIEELGDWEY